MAETFFVQVHTHFGLAVKKGKTERVDQIENILKTFLYTLRTFQSNRILTMSIFSPVILNGYKFTD